MRTLVAGATGQLGTDVVHILRIEGYEVFACDRNELDITDLAQCQRVVGRYHPDVVIHCAVYTAVDAAETDIDAAYR